MFFSRLSLCRGQHIYFESGSGERVPVFSGMGVAVELDNGGFHRKSVRIPTFPSQWISEMKA